MLIPLAGRRGRFVWFHLARLLSADRDAEILTREKKTHSYLIEAAPLTKPVAMQYADADRPDQATRRLAYTRGKMGEIPPAGVLFGAALMITGGVILAGRRA